MGLVHQWASWSLSTQVVRMSVTTKKSCSRVTICCRQGNPLLATVLHIWKWPDSIGQQFPTFLAPGTCFVEDDFSMDGGRRGRRGRHGLGGNASDGEWWEAADEAVFVHLMLTSCSADLGRNRTESVGNYNIRRRRRGKIGKYLLRSAEMSWRAAWGTSNRAGL